MTNRTILLALAGLAAGAGAAMMLMPRTRNAIASQGRLALGYASDQAGDYWPGARRTRRPSRRRAAKRKYNGRGRKTAPAV